MAQNLTIRRAQLKQPWEVPYGARIAEEEDETEQRDLLSRHVVLHVMKSAGKLASVFEKADHDNDHLLNAKGLDVVKAMAADLVTAALRLANLYGFDMQGELEKRVEEKNGKGFEDDDDDRACEHSDHPNFMFPVHVDFVGSGEGCDTDELWRLSFGATHALVYADGCVAVTLHECCYGFWGLSDGTALQNERALWGAEYRLDEGSIMKIHAHLKRERC